MDLLQLRYFCDAAQEENFSKTAHKYGVPPSNISQTVHRLENELGVKLFKRSANKIVLNSQGKLFCAKIKSALELIDDAKKEITDYDDSRQKEIRLKVCTNRRIVTVAIEKFKAKYPDVNFYLSHHYKDEGEFDMVISDIVPLDDNKTRELLVTEKIMVALRRDNPLCNIKKADLSMFKNERFISMPEDSSLYRITEDICLHHGFKPNIAIKSDDPYYVRRYAELGLGVMFVPSFSWQGQFSGEIRFMDICGYSRDTFVFYNSQKYMPQVVKEFKQILFDVCKHYA